ncbi:endonuclease/exonuclease/phosphatase family protein [Pontibacter ramchanderi]|uniref:Endonuclease/exonuclease/phosphatase (EEP) superfamily protein YafD n=1 Tax=Pontibacter ramchanderi TaxID=1179743 RepID=A0A2N3UB80_9BACT|nr:endonuclease/exonuclease/phosphatase family protein [Pontibacter ramchanderi]PKV66617.1 endonuclease/exonuclease/phosphatase (EEP) superfamily protein YafD [Pontibacter ramchanderi]
MKLTLQIAGFVLTLFSFLPLIKSPLWWIRVLDFPRLHVAILLTGVLVAYVALFGFAGDAAEIAMLVLWVLAIANEMRYVYFFTPVAPVEALRTEVAKPANCITLMISNVRMTNKKYEKFLQLVLRADPDIVLINEPDSAWHQHLQPELSKRFPYAIEKPLENTYGMLLYSKFKLLDSEIRFMVEDDIPSFFTTVELPSGLLFDLYTVHPQPPRLLQNTETREAELLIAAKAVKKSPHPSIVAGDLNDVAWSSTTKLFKQISGMLDPRVGRGFYNTYNAYIPLFRYPLDHVFYDPSFRLVHMERLPKFGSDHFPILITLNYEPKLQNEQQPPKADAEDHEEANELIQEGLEKGEERNEEKEAENGRK